LHATNRVLERARDEEGEVNIMGGSTYACNICGDAIRISSLMELKEFQEFHNKREKCNGKYESIWKDYDRMSDEQKDKLIAQVMGTYGKLGKLRL